MIDNEKYKKQIEDIEYRQNLLMDEKYDVIITWKNEIVNRFLEKYLRLPRSLLSVKQILLKGEDFTLPFLRLLFCKHSCGDLPEIHPW